jgi:hypothetical protein
MFWNDLVAISQYIVDFIDKHAFINAIFIAVLTLWSKSCTDKKLEEYKSFANKELKNYEFKNQNDLEKVKSDLALNLEVSKRYSSEQFKLYNNLWISLYDLKITGDNLWAVANTRHLKAFVAQLKKTEDQIDRHSLLVEDQDYSNLMKLINNFNQFRLGKNTVVTVVEWRKNNYNNYDPPFDEIETLVHRNAKLKDDYSELLVHLKEDFKRQIRGV